MRAHRAGTAPALLLAFALVATACGSTAKGANQAMLASDNASEDGLSLDAAPGNIEGAQGDAETPLGGAFDARLPGDGQTTGSGASSERARSTAAVAPGVTDSAILIGIEDAQSADAILASSGITGANEGNNTRKAQALVDHINARGGVGGRKLMLVVYTVDPNSGNNAQAACAHWTQDNKVFAVLTYAQASGETLKQCLSDKKVIFLSDHGTHFDGRDLQTYPNLWPVGGFNIERKIPAYVDGLAAQGFFSPWNHNTAASSPSGVAKVGLVYYDDEFNKRHNARIRSELSGHGLRFAQEFGVRNDNNAQADISAAVLRFKSEGITHVLFNQEINGALFGLFAAASGSQQYFPRYGVSSLDFPQIVKTNLPDRRVLNGMKGVGWLPFLDVDTPAPFDAAEQECLKIYRDTRQEPSDANERTIMLINCDVFFKFASAATAAGRLLNQASFFGGITRLGSQASYAYSSLDYSRHLDGIASVSYLEYATGCDCVRYTKRGVLVP